MTAASDEIETACLVALAGLPHIGPATLRRCLLTDGAAATWTALVAGAARRTAALAPLRARLSDGDLAHLADAARQTDPHAELLRNRSAGRWVRVHGQPGYPARLAGDPAPPAVLFGHGEPTLLDLPAVAVVGTRSATRLGRDLASKLGEDLSQAGLSVVSGLASGIDGAAHLGALRAARAAGGGEEPAPPIGVIASGLDIAYPQRHRGLHDDVARAGVLISETPLGRRPDRWRFPARNRIIAALSLAVVVVESRSKGGSILTAGEALDRGVPVLAVPGHPMAASAAGANDLIFDGATPCRGIEDVLGVLGMTVPASAVELVRAAAIPGPGTTGHLVLTALEPGARVLEELLVHTGLALPELTRTLADLESHGLVARDGGWFQRSCAANTPSIATAEGGR